MLEPFFVQFGIIIFPICIYQIWVFAKSFNQIPFRTPLMGIYGGGSAILCQLLPVHIFGQSENFQCVPIILSILYGKRRGGILSILILAGYQFFVYPQPISLVYSILGIVVYSAIPMIITGRFERYDKERRLYVALLLSLVTLAVELIYIAIYVFSVYGKGAPAVLAPFTRMLAVASIIQLALMGLLFLLLENIISNGRTRSRYQSVIEYNPLGIVSFDTNDKITFVNAAYEAITGYTRSELLGQSRMMMLFEEDHFFAAELREQQLAHGDIASGIELSIRRKDGQQVMIQSTVVPTKDGDDIIGFFAMIRDLTDTKTAEEALRNSEKLAAIGQLAAGVAHEIRNPLTALKGFLHLIPKAKEPERYISIMQNELTRIEQIVNELVVLAKPQATRFSVTDITEDLRSVVNLLAAQATMKSIGVTTLVEEGLPKIECEPNQLKQVFLNLIKNAIEATPESGKITIRLERLNRDNIVVRIRDTGPGIASEVLSRMGEPFFTTKETGTGLGLTMCNRIIENHHGRIEFTSHAGEQAQQGTSEPAERGTTVRVVLPCRQPDRRQGAQTNLV